MPTAIALLVLLWPPVPTLSIHDRHISQLGGSWAIDYRLSYMGPPRRLNLPKIHVSGTFSNSSVPGHTVPVERSYSGELPAAVRVGEKCQEAISAAASTNVLMPGVPITIRLELKHDHWLYAKFDPLLGRRAIRLQLADGVQLIDELDLIGDTQLNDLKLVLNRPENHADDQVFQTAPDSICVSTEEFGMQFVRFEDVPVRPGTPIKLSFWYMIAHGNAAECRMRVNQYQDKPHGYFKEPDAIDTELSGAEVAMGQWTHFEHEWLTGSGTNAIAVDFRIVGPNVGAMWVDDAELVYVDDEAATLGLSRTLP